MGNVKINDQEVEIACIVRLGKLKFLNGDENHKLKSWIHFKS
jgi:hypothetical protein